MTDRRFASVARVYGEAGCQRLWQSHVVVVGIGGVGSWAAEALARSGVGRLTQRRHLLPGLAGIAEQQEQLGSAAFRRRLENMGNGHDVFPWQVEKPSCCHNGSTLRTDGVVSVKATGQSDHRHPIRLFRRAPRPHADHLPPVGAKLRPKAWGCDASCGRHRLLRVDL